MSVENRPIKAYGALLAVYLIWGTTLGSIHIGVADLPWAVLPCLRFTLAGLLLLIICILRGERFPHREDLKRHFTGGALLFFGGNSIVCWAVKHMSTGLGGLLVATTPFWMVWLSSLFPPREKVSSASLLGILIGFLGMIVLLWPQLSHGLSTPTVFWASVLASLANTFFWSVGSVYVRKNPTPQSSLLMTVAFQNLAGGLLLMPVCWLTVPDWSVVHLTHTTWMALSYLILVGTAIATPCYLYVLHQLPVSVSSTFAYVTPVLTVFFGWLFLKESLTPLTLFGMAIILTGVIVVQWVNQMQAARPAPVDPPESIPVLEGVS
jgi:drug/metabolite transporter (DMT)-like permease